VSLVLASGSAARRRMLAAAGLQFRVIQPSLDEEAAKVQLRSLGLSPRDQALALAEQKALSVSSQGLVIGADQMLALGDHLLDKPRDLAEARAHLQRLRGAMHELLTAIVVTRNGGTIWRCLDAPRLFMRNFSDEFLDDYLAHAGASVLTSVGAYQLEGIGAQLFDRIEGEYFSVLGLPLLPLLAFLREQGVAPT